MSNKENSRFGMWYVEDVEIELRNKIASPQDDRGSIQEVS